MSTPTIDRLNAALEGRYKIESELGEGGMAKVYLAEDLKHKRKVAIKVLKPELAAVVGGERFLSEIETTAQLQHPHILPLFDSGEADSFLFFVMPYIEGETLRDRLDREKQLPVEEALGIAVKVASALQAAHDKGIVHRDIKPGNILMSQDQPLVADFGIALAVGSAGGSRLTETGLSVGTPYYMSPEQATGDQVVGPPSDTFALACVLYEMLVGEPPYAGNTAQAVLGKIIQGAPVSATAVRRSIPLNVDAAIRKGLEKLPADRFSRVGDFARALGDAGFRHGEDGSGVGSGGRVGRLWQFGALGAAAVAALLAGVLAMVLVLRPTVEQPVARYEIALPQGHVGNITLSGQNLALAPDGSSLVYAGPPASGAGAGGASALWIKRRDQFDPVPINGTEGGLAPSFSPGGDRVAFLAGGSFEMKVVSLTGEPPLTILDSGVGAPVLEWGTDGFLYFTNPAFGLSRVPETGGEVEVITEVDGAAEETAHTWVHALPEGRGLLHSTFYQPTSALEEYTIKVLDLETRESRVLLQGVAATYSPSGHIVYVAADGTLLAAPFDAESLELTGPPVALAEGMAVGGFGFSSFDVAGDGSAVFVTGSTSSGLAEVVWVDRDGTVTPVEEGWQVDPGIPEGSIRLSPDGTRAALTINSESGEDIWIKELDDGPLSRLTFDPAVDRRPWWSADGERVYYISGRGGDNASLDLWSQPSDGTGSAELVLDPDATLQEAALAPGDGALVVRLGSTEVRETGRDIVRIPPGGGDPEPLAAERYDEKGLALSADGRWLAYESLETGRDEIYVRPYPDADQGKWQVSTGGGINPRWSRDGTELFYIGGDGRMMAAQVDGVGTSFRVGERRPLFSVNERNLFYGANYSAWDVAPDGRRFLMLRLGGSADAGSELVLVQNFFRVLRERAGEGE